MGSFFNFECPQFPGETDENPTLFDTYTEEELKILSSPSFFVRRIESPSLQIDEALRKFRDELATMGQKESEENLGFDLKKSRPGRVPRAGRGGQNRKTDKKNEYNSKSQEFFMRITNEECSANIGLAVQKDRKPEDCIFLPISGEAKLNILYGTQSIYSFFRHFHCLYERLIKARTLAASHFEEELEKRPDLIAKMEPMLSQKKEEFKSERYELIYLRCLCSILRGNLEAAKYEDFCRAYLGSQSYLLFTMDKLINSIVKILQQKLVAEESSMKALELYNYNLENQLPEILYYSYYNRLILY